jgi:hypothetical protein
VLLGVVEEELIALVWSDVRGERARGRLRVLGVDKEKKNEKGETNEDAYSIGREKEK